MPITLDDLTVRIDHLDRGTLLADWQWRIGPDRFPILATAMGNAFVRDAATGAVALLDVGTGELIEIADSVDAFRSLLDDAVFVGEHFLVNDWIAVREAGKVLASGQVFGYIQPPALGGAFEPDNLEPTDIAVHFSVNGQIHRQVQDLPDGASIDSIKIA